MKLLILNSDLPIFPGQAGHEYLHTTGLARLVDRLGLVSLLHTREQNERKQALFDAGVSLYLWSKTDLRQDGLSQDPARCGWLRRVGETLYNRARNWRWRPVDTLIQDLQFRHLSRPLLDALSSESWQALVVVQSQCAHWLDYVPRPPLSVLVLHDIRALVYERKAAVARSLWQRFVHRRQAHRYRRFEREYCRRYDLVITVSRADEAWVRAHYRPRRLATVAIPVDRSYFAPMPWIPTMPARILFTGMMSHPPNADAAGFFAREVLPRIHASVPEAEFWVVGRDVTPPVRALGALRGVAVTGFVPDMRPHLAQATVVVVPIRFGSGMRNKILEAWAMEKCVVSTRVGAEGLECQDGVDILLADDAEGIAARVVQAIRDPGLRDRIRARGRLLVSTSHDPAPLAQSYRDIVSNALQEARPPDNPLRAVIDLRWMRPELAGGIEKLSRSFLDHLLRLDRSNRYKVLAPADVLNDFDTRGHSNFTFAVADGPGVYARKTGLAAARFLHGLLKVQYWRTPEVETLRRARALDADIALSIPGYIHPDLTPLPNVLIMPDIQHEYFPEFSFPRDLDERRRLYTASAKRAVHICAISEFIRQTLIERLGIAPERVTTTYLAADPIFHPYSPLRGNNRKVLEKYGLKSGEYLLFPANTRPHKNHAALFQALRVLREAYGLAPPLVCTGSANHAPNDLLAQVREARLADQVRFLGYCPPTDMPGLYEGAATLVFPSLFEGFGLPLLEAMWCDCPIVCSNVTSLPETAGDAALLVDPRSPEALAHALSRVLTEEALRRDLVERGRRRVRDFSWTNFTVQVVSALHRARQALYG